MEKVKGVCETKIKVEYSLLKISGEVFGVEIEGIDFGVIVKEKGKWVVKNERMEIEIFSKKADAILAICQYFMENVELCIY